MKINKIKINKFSEKLRNIAEAKIINENYVMPFGKLKGLTIREAIIVDFQYVDWCVKERIFELNRELKEYFDLVVASRTFEQSDFEFKKDDLPWD